MNDKDRSAIPLSNDDDNLALAGLVDSEPTILAVALVVRRPDVSAEISPIDFDLTPEGAAMMLACRRFAQLVREYKSRLALADDVPGDL